MQINDLPHLENVVELQTIVGSAGVIVDSRALALGEQTSTLTLANTQARLLPSGVSIARGIGFAKAKGDVTATSVSVAGFGDIVVGKTRTTPDGSKSFGFVVAVDIPNH
jgi:hypothetical protein